MKKILLILLILLPFVLFAQSDREILLDISKQLSKQGEQIAELSKQQAVTTTKIDGLKKSVDKRLDTLEKSIDKRFEMLTNLMIGLMGLIGILIAAMLGFISYIFWDRQAALKPVEATTAELKKEIDLLKEKELKHIEKELKHQEKETQTDNILKKLLEKFPDLANLA